MKTLNRSTLAIGAAMLAGCASAPPLAITARMADEKIRAKVDAEFPAGLTLEEVQSRLDALGVSRRYRRTYPGPPPTLLARVFERRSFWIRYDGPEDVTFVDLWFLFPDKERLERVEMERTRQRYLDGDPIDPPFTTPEIPPREVPGWVGESGQD